MLSLSMLICSLFFFNDTATTEIYTLSLHDALPIYPSQGRTVLALRPAWAIWIPATLPCEWIDRKSTRLNSSHANISYAVFCLKKKKCRSYAAAPSLENSSKACECCKNGRPAQTTSV